MEDQTIPSPPAQPAPKPPILPILLSSLIFLVLGIFLGKYLFSSTPTVSVAPTLSPSSTPTPVWQTYSYKDMSFQYSTDFSPIQRESPPTTLLFVGSPTGSELQYIALPKEGIGFECAQEISSTQINLGGFIVTRTINITPTTELCNDDGHETAWVSFDHNNIKYALTYYYQKINSAKERLLFDHILSTFKFTNANQVFTSKLVPLSFSVSDPSLVHESLLPGLAGQVYSASFDHSEIIISGASKDFVPVPRGGDFTDSFTKGATLSHLCTYFSSAAIVCKNLNSTTHFALIFPSQADCHPAPGNFGFELVAVVNNPYTPSTSDLSGVVITSQLFPANIPTELSCNSANPSIYSSYRSSFMSNYQSHQLDSNIQTNIDNFVQFVSSISFAAPTPTIAPITSWQKYTNSNLGFSFDYPSTYQINNHTNLSADMALDLTIESQHSFGFIGVNAYVNPDHLSLQAWIKSHNGCGLNTDELTPITYQPISIAQTTGYRNQQHRVCPPGGGGIQDLVYLEHSGTIYELTLSASGGPLSPNDVPAFSHLLSTFKFTN